MSLLQKIFNKKNNLKKDFQVGDWINSYSKGIFRIEQIIDEYYDESDPILGNNIIGEKKEHRTIVSKRLLNSKFKKSIGFETCSEFYVSYLDDLQKNTLDQILLKTPELLKTLNDFTIPKRIAVYNSELQIVDENELKLVHKLIDFIKDGKTFLQIQNEMENLDILKLKPKNFGNYKFQIFNYDNEYSAKRRIWRNAKLTKL